MSMIGRRAVLKSLAALPLLGHSALGARNRGVAIAPIRLGDDRLWVEVGFGGQSYPFVIDTGAFMNLISRRWRWSSIST